MDASFSSSFDSNDFSVVPVAAASLKRTLLLTNLRDWCMDRLSQLSLDDRMECSRALTAEHLELLEVVNQATTLWMVIERRD